MNNSLDANAPSPEVLTVLSVSPLPEDHLCLQAIMGHSRWKFLKADQLSSATALLETHTVSVVLCDQDLMHGTWVELLKYLQGLSNPPSLIVTSRVADERLWAEALNLGAWDVLAKPFGRYEVIRTVKVAWDHWQRQTPTPSKSLAAAG